MIESVEFRNFRVLRNTTLPLSRLTLIIGPNGSGKSTAMQALRAAARPREWQLHQVATAGLPIETAIVEVILHGGEAYAGVTISERWEPDEQEQEERLVYFSSEIEEFSARKKERGLHIALERLRIYAFHAAAIVVPVRLEPKVELREDGGHLAGVLDRLRDNEPERFEALNGELSRWLPEFDRILFDTPHTGQRAFLLRTRKGLHKIPAEDLSHGTLFALAVLTLAYLPDPPPLVCLEEPDKGIHPRLLRRVQDALYRLSYPENCGETRPPVQVLATTHSPYFLDLFKDHPEEIVLAQKVGLEARFERLSERPDIDEILAGAPLGEIWYSGILGGVPAEP